MLCVKITPKYSWKVAKCSACTPSLYLLPNFQELINKLFVFHWSFVFNIFKKKNTPEYLLLDKDNQEFNFSTVGEFTRVGKFFYRGEHVITLERYELLEDKLVIEHFASHLNENLNVKVKGMGEPFLRFLAQFLLDNHPQIKVIEFELSSTLSRVKNSPELLKTVRDARRSLLNRIGVSPVSVLHPIADCYIVKGRWYKSSWV